MSQESFDGIFINYRQRDSSNRLRNHTLLVEALSHRLAGHFGENTVFVDTSMRAGSLYPMELRTKLTTCQVLLAIIHPEWLDDLRQRQAKQGPDWVLDEITTALNGDPRAENHATLRPLVIPILLERAELPQADELPDNIRELADLEAFRFCSGSIAEDIAHLVKRLEDHLPGPWQSSLDDEAKKSEFLLDQFPMGLLGILGILLYSTDKFLGVVVFSVLMMTLMFLLSAASLIFRRYLYRANQHFQTLPAMQLFSIGGLSIIGVALLLFYPLVANSTDSIMKATLTATLLLAAFFFLFLFTISSTAPSGQDDVKWPPTIPIHRVPDRTASLRRAVVRLEENLTSSWCPPLSRVQRDQAQHLVLQLSKAVTTLRGETKRGRLDWLREEHPRSVVISVIWLVGTIGLAVALLVDDGYTGRAHYLSVLTPVVAPMLFLGTMEFCYRHQRRGNNWLATEIEASLHDRLLPYLPPHSCDR